MPIKRVTRKVKDELEALTTDSWLDAATINKMFSTQEQKKKLAKLRESLLTSASENEKAAAIWNRLSQFKDIVTKIVKKTAGL